MTGGRGEGEALRAKIRTWFDGRIGAAQNAAALYEAGARERTGAEANEYQVWAGAARSEAARLRNIYADLDGYLFSLKPTLPPEPEAAERRVSQRRSEANSVRSEGGPEQRSFKDRRRQPKGEPEAASAWRAIQLGKGTSGAVPEVAESEAARIATAQDEARKSFHETLPYSSIEPHSHAIEWGRQLLSALEATRREITELKAGADEARMGHVRLDECSDAAETRGLYDRISKKIQKFAEAAEEQRHIIAAGAAEKDILRATANAAEHRQRAAEYRAQRIVLDAELKARAEQAEAQRDALKAALTELSTHFAPGSHDGLWGRIKAFIVEGAPTRAEGIQIARQITEWQVAVDDALLAAEQE